MVDADSNSSVDRFELGEEYERQELHDEYGGNRQSGISPCGDYPIIFVFTGSAGDRYGYEDGFLDDGRFIYTGEGKEGDMEFVRGNKALRDHQKTGDELHLFHQQGDGSVIYLGQFKYSDHEWVQLPDEAGNDREAIRFTFAPIGEILYRHNTQEAFSRLSPEDSQLTNPERTPKVLMARGYKHPFHRNVSRSLANYFSASKREELRSILSEYHDVEGLTEGFDPTHLQSLLDSDTVTAWGSKEKDVDLFRELVSGDYFVMRTGQPPVVQYIQRIDLLIGAETPIELRRQLSEAIWGSKDYEYLWFSDSKVVEIDLPEEEFVELIQEIKPNFDMADWFPSQGKNATIIEDQVVDHFGGSEEFIKRLAEYDGSPRDPETRNYFWFDCVQTDRDVREEHFYEFKQTATELSNEVLDAENDGRVLLHEHGTVFAHARIGNIEGTRRDGSIYKSVNLLDLQEVTPTTIDELKLGNGAISEGGSQSILSEFAPGDLPSVIDCSEETYHSVIEQIEPQIKSTCSEITSEQASYYWVNQGENKDEVAGDFLRAPDDGKWYHDLAKLGRGDVVFNYHDGEIIGYSEVTETASPEVIEGGVHCRVEVEFVPFEEPLAFADVFSYLQRDDVRLDDYYPVSAAGINQHYLYNLSEAAGEYLFEQGIPTEQYDGLSAAEADLEDDLEEVRSDIGFLEAELIDRTIHDWTTVLRRNKVERGEVRQTDYDTVDQIKKVYESNESQLTEIADRFGVGELEPCSPSEVLYVVLIRELQREAGIQESQLNFDHNKLESILNETYRDEQTIPTTDQIPPDTEELARQLQAKGQLVFHGPPGTGKTYTAQQFCRWWLNSFSEDPYAEQFQTVTFHPSFTYEDFIEGLTAKEQNGTVEYKVEPGVFRNFVSAAKDAYEDAVAEGSPEDAPPYVFLIDEINRGNLAQVFGETITLLEQDKRLDAENETTVELPHSNDPFVIPPNVFVIGTMNTADRSIALVDAALRRRFRFVHFAPSIETLCEEYSFSDYDSVLQAAESSTDPADQLLALSICALKHLNKQIRSNPDLGRGKQLGHTTLLGINRDQPTDEELQSIRDRWRYEIMPLLEEYYFGQFDRIDQELFEGAGDHLFNTDTQEIRPFEYPDVAEACSELVSEINPDLSWLHTQ